MPQEATMRVLKILLINSLFLLSGCGTAWVIYQDQHGGEIGYKKYRSPENASEAIKKLIPCPNWTRVSDRLQLSEKAVVVPMSNDQTTYGTARDNYGNSINYQQNTYGTQYVPMVVDNSYRIFTYRCAEDDVQNQITKNIPIHEADKNTDISFIDREVAASHAEDFKNDNLKSVLNDIKLKLNQRTLQFKYCYQSELDRAKLPERSSGKIQLEFEINKNGSVISSTATSIDNLADSTLTCIKNVLDGIPFQARESGPDLIKINQKLNLIIKSDINK